jgi:hypothetical protein
MSDINPGQKYVLFMPVRPLMQFSELWQRVPREAGIENGPA